MNNGFLYFIPGASMSTTGREGLAAQLEAARLSNVLPDGSMTQNSVAGGPCGKGNGLMFSCARQGEGDPIFPKYEPAKQTWIDAGTHCVGYYTDNPPAPSDLVRRRPVHGYAWVDDRDEKWIVPLARVCDGSTLLPNTMGIGADGKMVKKPKARYKDLCAFAQAHFEMLTGLLDRGEFAYKEDWDTHFSVACEALGVNYHVGPYEITVLECMDETGVSDVCARLCDIFGLKAMLDEKADAQKKTDSAETGDG